MYTKLLIYTDGYTGEKLIDYIKKVNFEIKFQIWAEIAKLAMFEENRDVLIMEYVIPLCKIDITKWASKLPQRMVEDFKSECYIEIIKNLENYTPVLEEGSRILGNVYFDYRFRKVFTDFVRQLKKEEKEVHSIENEENIPTNTDLFHDCLMKEVLEVYENHMNNYVAWYAKKKTRQHCKKHNISLNDFLNS